MINVCRILLLLIINSMLAAGYFKDSDNIEHTINIEYALSNFSEPKLSEKYNSKEMKNVGHPTHCNEF